LIVLLFVLLLVFLFVFFLFVLPLFVYLHIVKNIYLLQSSGIGGIYSLHWISAGWGSEGGSGR